METGRPKRVARACMMGMKMTTTGMLLRKALTAITTARTMASDSHGHCPVCPSSQRAPRSRIPVRTMAWPMTRSASTEIRAGLAKPCSRRTGLSRLIPSASSTGKKWKKTRSEQTTPTDVTSMGTRSMAYMTSAPMMMANVASIWKFGPSTAISLAMAPLPFIGCARSRP